MNKDYKTILQAVDGFLQDLRSKGYAERTISVRKIVFSDLSDYFENNNPPFGESFIADFIDWKISCRSQKQYHWSHRYRQARLINGFFAYYLKFHKTLHVSRCRFEKQIPGYARTLKGGTKNRTLKEMRSTLASFFDYLTKRGVKRLKVGKDKPIDQQIMNDFLDFTERNFYKNRSNYCRGYANGIRKLLVNFHNYLIEHGHPTFYTPPPPREEAYRFDEPIKQYLEYLNANGLSDSTIGIAKRELKKFDDYLIGKGIKDLDRVKVNHIDEHVQNTATTGLRSIHRLNCILRRFFKFLYVTEVIKRDIAKFIVAAPIYRLGDVPKALTGKEIKAVLTFSRPLSKPDMKKRAVLSLLMFNGLRVGEVSRLCLDDIDWDEQTITIAHRKNRQPLITPMSDYVKSALMEYISKARPKESRYREVFLSRNAPIKPISSRGITQMMIRQLAKHGVTCGGGHKMRHTFGTYLLESDSSLKEAQLLLGHSQINSTRIYGKSSLKRMREHVVSDEI